MRVRKSPLEPRRRAALGLVLAALASGCEPTSAHSITIVDGASTTRFTTKSAFAEYVELPGMRNELRITLANYAVSCEAWEAPKEGDVALSLAIVTAAGSPPTPASYPWNGLPAHDEPLHEPYALPKAWLGTQSRLFEPGGAARLSAVSLELHGSVIGSLAFEYPGDGNRAATRVDGAFEAKVCRSAVASH